MTGLAIGLAFLSGFGAGAVALAVWLGLALLLRLRSNLSKLAFSAILLSAGLGAGLAWQVEQRPQPVVTAGMFDGTIEVANGPFLTQLGQRFTGLAPGGNGARYCIYAGAAPRPLPGDVLQVKGEVTLAEDLSSGGQAAARSRDCDAQLRLTRMEVAERGSGVATTTAQIRANLSDLLMWAAPGDPGALLSGLVTGDDGALSDDSKDAFLSSGTTHITAISGANFAMIVLVLGLLASGSMKRNIVFISVVVAVIWAYALVVGLQPSAVRAALLATAVLIGRRLGRAPDLLTLTVLLGALQVLIRPSDFSSLGFQLSMAATIALIVVFDGRERTGDGRWATNLVIAVIAAQLATIPILVAQLGSLSGISLVANLVVGPLATVAFPLALVGSLIGMVNASLGLAALQPAIGLSAAILWMVDWSEAHLPGILQVGEPTIATIGVVAIVTWGSIFWMSGDLRRMARHGLVKARDW